ncbi:MAG: hypothetical protein HDT43_12970 [Ruminococcaceae bacterium]|nr:hypothetical protein [Oscillospiraceae bacterium]
MKKHIIFLSVLATLTTGCGASPESKPLTESSVSESEPLIESVTASDNTVSTESSQKDEQTEEENDLSIEITVNGRTFSAELYDNETASAFAERLPLTLDMNELNGNEKYYYLPESLPKNSSRPSGINVGDIMLFGGDCLVIFYDSFSTSYSYTPIGKIVDTDGLAKALGSGGVQVSFR